MRPRQRKRAAAGPIIDRRITKRPIAAPIEDGQIIRLDVYNGRINLMTKKVHDERMQLATANMADDLRTLEKLGLK